MYNIKTMNKIAAVGLDRLPAGTYAVGDAVENEDAILVRSAKLHDYPFPEKLWAIARAGAGVNNIPVDKCSEAGIVVFNTPGANANAVKELVICALLNIALDPLLIFTFHLGVAGAAWATIISQFVSFCLLLAGCARGGNLHIHIARVQRGPAYYVQIVRGGLPSLARQGRASVAAICLNRAAGPYGDAAIAAMGVVQRVMMFGGSAMIGFGQGFQPVCGFNYGAKLYHRVKQGFWFCVKASFGFLLAVSALGFAFAPRLVALFRDDRSVIEIGAMALRFQCATLCLSSWIVMSNMMLQTIGKTAGATLIAMSRQGIFFIPLVYVLSRSLGLLGVEMTQSAADGLTLLCTVPIQLRALREMDALESAQSPP